VAHLFYPVAGCYFASRSGAMGYTRRLKLFIAQIPEAAHATLSLLTFFELFSGMRAWSRGMEMFDYHGQSADWKYQKFTEKTVKCDFLTPMGFLQVIASIMRMHARSIFLAGIPCSSWIFMSRWSTGRDKHILGHHRVAWIRSQNGLVARKWCMCLFFASSATSCSSLNNRGAPLCGSTPGGNTLKEVRAFTPLS